MFDEEAQLHTLESVAAATIILLVIIYAIDATSMTPLSSSTANIHMESELAVLGQDILNTLDYSEPGYDSKLKNDLKQWDGKIYVWNGSNYKERDNTSSLNNNLTSILSQTLASRAIAHNVELLHLILVDNSSLPATAKIIQNGDPSNNAVIVSRKIVLHDGDINTTKYPENPVEDIDSSTKLYNIVQINLILWRM